MKEIDKAEELEVLKGSEKVEEPEAARALEKIEEQEAEKSIQDGVKSETAKALDLLPPVYLLFLHSSQFLALPFSLTPLLHRIPLSLLCSLLILLSFPAL